MSIPELRAWIAANYRDDNIYHWILTDSFVVAIQPLLPIELIVVELPPSRGSWFNCYPYAFGLQNDASFLMRPNVLGDNRPVARMIQEGILIPTELPEPRDYIIYRNEGGGITHAGLFEDAETVISKWGDGPVLKHPTLAVPRGYGTNIAYYKRTPPERIRHFLKVLEAETS